MVEWGTKNDQKFWCLYGPLFILFFKYEYSCQSYVWGNLFLPAEKISRDQEDTAAKFLMILMNKRDNFSWYTSFQPSRVLQILKNYYQDFCIITFFYCRIKIEVNSIDILTPLCTPLELPLKQAQFLVTVTLSSEHSS